MEAIYYISDAEELPVDIRAQWEQEEAERLTAAKRQEEALQAFCSLSERDTPRLYVRVPTRVADGSKRLTAPQMTCYAALSFLAHNTTRVVSWEPARLAEACGVSVRSLPRVLKALEGEGLIEKRGRNEAVVPAPREHVRIAVEALWSAKPAIRGTQVGGTPLLASGAALRVLAGLLLAISWETWTVTRSHQSLAKQMNLGLSQFREGLKALQETGLVVAHPEVAYRRVSGGVHRQVVPLRIKWSAATEWEQKKVEPHTRVLREWYGLSRGKNIQSVGEVAGVIKKAVATYGEDATRAALARLTEAYMPVTEQSVRVELKTRKSSSSSIFRATRQTVGQVPGDEAPY